MYTKIKEFLIIIFKKKKRSSHGHSLDVACKKPSIETSNELGIECNVVLLLVLLLLVFPIMSFALDLGLENNNKACINAY
jgi:hypothetical protein